MFSPHEYAREPHPRRALIALRLDWRLLRVLALE